MAALIEAMNMDDLMARLDDLSAKEKSEAEISESKMSEMPLHAENEIDTKALTSQKDLIKKRQAKGTLDLASLTMKLEEYKMEVDEKALDNGLEDSHSPKGSEFSGSVDSTKTRDSSAHDSPSSIDSLGIARSGSPRIKAHRLKISTEKVDSLALAAGGSRTPSRPGSGPWMR